MLGVYPVDSWRLARYALIAKLRRVTQYFWLLATVFPRIALMQPFHLICQRLVRSCTELVDA